MHKNLHKDLYSKRNKRKKYPPVNNITISPSDKDNYETEENVTVISKKKYNRLAIYATLIASGLIIFGYSFFSSSSQKEINLLSVDHNEIISEDSTSTTSTTTTTTAAVITCNNNNNSSNNTNK